MSNNGKLKITIGPAPFSWGRGKLLDFYCKELPTEGIEAVYVGDNVCSKRRVLNQDDFKAIADSLHSKGIKAYYSTLALSTTQEEFDLARKECLVFDGLEANTLGHLSLLQNGNSACAGKELILGPYLNLYNWKSVTYLRKYNPSRLVAPFELPIESIKDIRDKAEIPVEVTAWGHLSTAVSWRCYIARAVSRTREECAMACFDYPNGMLLKSVENEELFRIEGSQVLGAKTHCLIEYVRELQDSGVDSIRIYPQMEHTADIVDLFRRVINDELPAKVGLERLTPYASSGVCNGWFLGKAGWEYVVSGSA